MPSDYFEESTVQEKVYNNTNIYLTLIIMSIILRNKQDKHVFEYDRNRRKTILVFKRHSISLNQRAVGFSYALSRRLFALT